MKTARKTIGLRRKPRLRNIFCTRAAKRIRSVVDTDFTAKLVDVAPDGFAQDLTEGILRMRYRASPEHPVLMNPGQIYEISLDLWATSNVFLRGHSMRLEISSSNVPRFDRNL